jgi:hypothetical protein
MKWIIVYNKEKVILRWYLKFNVNHNEKTRTNKLFNSNLSFNSSFNSIKNVNLDFLDENYLTILFLLFSFII